MSENEVRVFGPPGTGKTTWMAGTVRKTAEARATSRIIVASFTRAAATEIAGRGLPINRDQVGTLHALAYRAIGRPTVAEEHLPEWNRRYPALALSAGYKDIEQAPMEWRGSTEGDILMASVETLRARQLALDAWPTQERHFMKRWQEWKQGNGIVDFTDMIELALTNTDKAPGDPLVGFFDEVQDFTPLELALVRHWGKSMDRVVMAGDDDQAIYGFKGASPDAFLDPPLPDEQKRTLGQSFRVPRAVHAASQRWILTLTRREPKEYEPRDADGVVRGVQSSYEDHARIVKEVKDCVDEGRSVMILATCAYMIDPIKHALRADGVPFHNPYRRTRGDWNPLKPSRGTSSAERLLSYLIIDERMFPEDHRGWTGRDLKAWSDVVRKTGVFKRGAGKAIELLPDRELTFEEIAELFVDEAVLARAVEPDINWFLGSLTAGAKGGMDFPATVARRRGVQALMDEPKVVIGTIHSVKGGEADVVFLLPDLSMAGMREWDTRSGKRDQVIRQMYVGMTRAREELVICQASSSLAVEPALLMGRR